MAAAAVFAITMCVSMTNSNVQQLENPMWFHLIEMSEDTDASGWAPLETMDPEMMMSSDMSEIKKKCNCQIVVSFPAQRQTINYANKISVR